MKIKFSRHAKRRAKLYGLSLPTIENILAQRNFSSGKYEIVQEVPGQKFPVKIVFSVQKDTVTVITNYLLKKRRK